MKFTWFLAALALSSFSTQAAVFITEWAYDGSDGEFIEFTNTGTTAVDFTGWSFDDDSRVSGSFSLSAFGVVAAGQSVILTNAEEAAFRSAWSLSDGIRIIGLNDVNLGRADEINLFDADSALIDRLTYGDNTDAGGPRTQNVSGVTTPVNYGANQASLWVLSSIGDGISFSSAAGDIGNPGVAAIPEPGSWMLAAGSALALLRRRRA